MYQCPLTKYIESRDCIESMACLLMNISPLIKVTPGKKKERNIVKNVSKYIKIQKSHHGKETGKEYHQKKADKQNFKPCESPGSIPLKTDSVCLFCVFH